MIRQLMKKSIDDSDELSSIDFFYDKQNYIAKKYRLTVPAESGLIWDFCCIKNVSDIDRSLGAFVSLITLI